VRQMRAAGSRIIGISMDVDDEALLRAQGVDSVIAAADDAPAMLAALAEAMLHGQSRTGVWSLEESTATLGGECSRSSSPATSIAVWGPAGAPGRTTTALILAEALSLRGRTALVDADTAAPSMAVYLGLAEDISGILLACRHAESGSLTARTLDSVMCAITESLHALTGLSHARRRAEIRPLAMGRVLESLQIEYDYVVVDIGSHFGAGHSADLTSASVADAVMASADLIVAVCRPDPLGTARFLADLPALLEFGIPVTVVLSAGMQREESSALIAELARRNGMSIPVVDLALDAPSLERALSRGARPTSARRRGRSAGSVERLVALVA